MADTSADTPSKKKATVKRESKSKPCKSPIKTEKTPDKIAHTPSNTDKTSGNTDKTSTKKRSAGTDLETPIKKRATGTKTEETPTKDGEPDQEDEERDLAIRDSNTTMTDEKQRKKRSGYATPRKLIMWTFEVDQQLLLALAYEANRLGIALPMHEAMQHISPGSSDQAAYQHLAKVRVAREKVGQKVPPPMLKTRRPKLIENTVAKTQSSKKKGNVAAGPDDNTPSKSLVFVTPSKPKAARQSKKTSEQNESDALSATPKPRPRSRRNTKPRQDADEDALADDELAPDPDTADSDAEWVPGGAKDKIVGKGKGGKRLPTVIKEEDPSDHGDDREGLESPSRKNVISRSVSTSASRDRGRCVDYAEPDDDDELKEEHAEQDVEQDDASDDNLCYTGRDGQESYSEEEEHVEDLDDEEKDTVSFQDAELMRVDNAASTLSQSNSDLSPVDMSSTHSRNSSFESYHSSGLDMDFTHHDANLVRPRRPNLNSAFSGMQNMNTNSSMGMSIGSEYQTPGPAFNSTSDFAYNSQAPQHMSFDGHTITPDQLGTPNWDTQTPVLSQHGFSDHVPNQFRPGFVNYNNMTDGEAFRYLANPENYGLAMTPFQPQGQENYTHRNGRSTAPSPSPQLFQGTGFGQMVHQTPGNSFQGHAGAGGGPGLGMYRLRHDSSSDLSYMGNTMPSTPAGTQQSSEVWDSNYGLQTEDVKNPEAEVFGPMLSSGYAYGECFE